MSETIVLIGTRKGLWVARSDESREDWQIEGPHFVMQETISGCIDMRGDAPRIFAGSKSWHYGPQLYRSDDLGRSFNETPGGAIRFPEDTGASVEQIWQVIPGGADEPDVMWAGSEPSALWRSDDRGESFQLVRALWDHPHREQWEPGFGGQAIHTIKLDGRDADHVTVAMSTGGVYQTTDGGDSWNPTNTGIKAYFFPDPWPEFGQCVHKVDTHPDKPDQLFAQNHHGVYRSDDAGRTWTSIAEGLPSDFGFPIVVDPADPDTVFVFPLVADGDRMPPDGRAIVWRSRDAGRSWEAMQKGLPTEFYSAVMRDAMCADNAVDYGLGTGIYAGTRDGTLFASNDTGESWSVVAQHLPDIMFVRAATVG